MNQGPLKNKKHRKFIQLLAVGIFILMKNYRSSVPSVPFLSFILIGYVAS